METSVPVWEIVVSILALGGGIAGYFKIIVPFASRIKKWVTTWESFMEDWKGEEARPGRDRVPGVMERLNNIDGELKRNGGSSIKDSVDRIEKNVHTLSINTKEIKKRLEEGDKRFDNLEARVQNLEQNPPSTARKRSTKKAS